MPAGRPPLYDKHEVMGRICEKMSEGWPVSRVLSELDGMPEYNQLYRWMAKDKELSLNYAQARQDSADFYADEIITIADTEPDPNKARVMIDARKWVCSKLKPRSYGERLDVQHSGNLNVLAMTDEELLRIVQEQTGQPMLIECKDITPVG